VFGQVISGEAILRMIENLPTDTESKPTCDVHIANCGELVLQLKTKGRMMATCCIQEQSDTDSQGFMHANIFCHHTFLWTKKLHNMCDTYFQGITDSIYYFLRHLFTHPQQLFPFQITGWTGLCIQSHHCLIHSCTSSSCLSSECNLASPK